MEIAHGTVTVETMGIGWKILVPLSVLERLPKTGSEVKIYTSFQMRESDMALYGFLSGQDRQMFEMLLSVNGIGPKAAMGILSAFCSGDLRMAIVSEDVKAISRAPGIGPKTAKRIILDLKDRIKAENLLPEGIAADPGAEAAALPVSGETSQAVKEAAEALVALGYSPTEAWRAVRQASADDVMTSEEILKASLKYLL